MWHGLHQFMEDDVGGETGWMIEQGVDKGHYFMIRAGRYPEWTNKTDEALQFKRLEDATAFAEWHFGSPKHGHSFAAQGSTS